MRSFAITTLGCKVNRYESESISEQLLGQGWSGAEEGARADLCIVNTCTVTGKAATQSRQAVRRLMRAHPGTLVVVTGCYAQVAPEVFTSMEGVHHVVGTSLKDQIPSLASPGRGCPPPMSLVEDLSAPRPFKDLPITRFGNRTRPFLKIQDGCDSFCSYCVVPYARGRSCSLGPEAVTERIRVLAALGYSEVVLCGINVGQYGQDLTPATSLLELLRSIESAQGLRRLRLSSIEPVDLSEKMILHLATSKQLCRHLHIPLQSGDDEVLKGMNRPYGSTFYRDLIRHIIRMVTDVAIGVDVLVGFPGETERAFSNTCRLIEELPISYLHVFPFSARKGTPAEGLRDCVSPQTIKKRCQYLREMGQTKRVAFYERFVGCIQEVLIEGKRDRATGCLKGFTRNYIPVLVKGEDDLFHRLVEARLTRVEDGKVVGQCLSGD